MARSPRRVGRYAPRLSTEQAVRRIRQFIDRQDVDGSAEVGGAYVDVGVEVPLTVDVLRALAEPRQSEAATAIAVQEAYQRGYEDGRTAERRR